VRTRSALLALLAMTLAAGCHGDRSDRGGSGAVTSFAIVGPDAPDSGTAVALGQVADLLARATDLPVIAADGSVKAVPPPGALVLAIGASETSEAIVPAAEREALAPEGYILRSGTVNGNPAIAGVGPDTLGTPPRHFATGELFVWPLRLWSEDVTERAHITSFALVSPTIRPSDFEGVGMVSHQVGYDLNGGGEWVMAPVGPDGELAMVVCHDLECEEPGPEMPIDGPGHYVMDVHGETLRPLTIDDLSFAEPPSASADDAP